jgi:hypothetical protein
MKFGVRTAWLLILALAGLIGGCADTGHDASTQPLSAADQQKKLTDDPMSVGPNEDPSYVADHGLGGSARPSLSKQIHDFWNP